MFKTIVFMINGLDGTFNGFAKACEIAQHSHATLDVLVLNPALPDGLEDFVKHSQDRLITALNERVSKYAPDLAARVTFRFETAEPALVSAVSFAMRKEADLIIKDAEGMPANSGTGQRRKGFQSFDMGLLRKCPQPVWIYRDMPTDRAPLLSVAIDPKSDAPAGYDLGLKLLRVGQAFSHQLGGKMTVMSCWDFEYESFFRESGFAREREGDVERMIEERRQQHEEAVNRMVRESGIAASVTVLCPRGNPSDVIPAYIKEHGVDLLVMGSVARTGIPGFIMGNTAESILQRLTCSSLTAKPAGFISPIKAYA